MWEVWKHTGGSPGRCVRGQVPDDGVKTVLSNEPEKGRKREEKLEMNISRLSQEAEAGSCVAQSILGTCYLDGINVEVDYAKAFQLLSAASDQGASRAVANLARMYAGGLGLAKEMSQAVRLYEKAARAGDFFAMVELG